MTVTVELDDASAEALATVIRQIRPEDHGVDSAAWYRALDSLSPRLPKTGPKPLEQR